MNKLQKIIAWICIIGLTAILGCASFQDALTPCYISPACLEYADAEPTTFLPFTTLFDARRIDMKMDFRYAIGEVEYKFLKGLNTFHTSAAEQLQARIFSPEGPIGLLFPAITGGVLGTYLFSKPDDKKKIAELEKTNGNTNTE